MSAKHTCGGPAFPHPGGSSDSTVQESHLGMDLRDYFIAHAPAEPQQWFTPVLPPKEPPLPTFGELYPDCTDAEHSALNRFHPDYMRVEDVEEERVRNYLLQRQEQTERQRAYNAMAHREHYVQWPAAWADAMLKAREQ